MTMGRGFGVRRLQSKETVSDLRFYVPGKTTSLANYSNQRRSQILLFRPHQPSIR